MKVLFVKEMSCNHCVQRIHNCLEELGVTHTIDLQEKTVSVAEDAPLEKVIDELDDLGFTATLS